MSVHVTIEHGIPMPPPPPKKKRTVSGLRWALLQMEVGDCFLIKKRHLSSVKSAANFARTKIKPFDLEPGQKHYSADTPMLRVFKVGMRQINQKGGDNHMAEPKTTTTTTTPKPETPKPTTTTTTTEEEEK